MKIINSNKLIKVIFGVLMLLVSTPAALTYPPDNAAVLYYNACLFYQVDRKMGREVSELVKGKIKPNEKIIKHVEKNRYAMNLVIDASEIKDCDWSLDYSKGMELMMPQLAPLKGLAKLLIADARILTQQGGYKTALSRCLTVQKMARHINDRMLIMYLVGMGINDYAYNCSRYILSNMPQDMETLTWLNSKLIQLDKEPFSAKPGLYGEIEMKESEIRMENKENFLKALSDENISPPDIRKLALDRVRKADEQFFKRNREYWNNYIADTIAAFDLPYPQAYSKLKQLGEKSSKEFSKNPNATLAAVFASAYVRFYNYEVKDKTYYGAIKTAIEIYMIKAKTGKLPDNLPAGMPKDLFSGKDFQYEKTSEGFILRCQGKDLVKDEIHQYEFKVKK